MTLVEGGRIAHTQPTKRPEGGIDTGVHALDVVRQHPGPIDQNGGLSLGDDKSVMRADMEAADRLPAPNSNGVERHPMAGHASEAALTNTGVNVPRINRAPVPVGEVHSVEVTSWEASTVAAITSDRPMGAAIKVEARHGTHPMHGHLRVPSVK